MSEAYVSERCVVLKRLPFRDSDAHLVLLGEHRGKLVALAKGVNKPESKLSSLLDVGHSVVCELYEGKGGFTLVGASQMNGFSRRYTSYAALLTSVTLCELVDAVTVGGVALDDIYTALVQMLSEMDDENLVEVRLRFFWDMLLLSGYASTEEKAFEDILMAHWRTSALSLHQQCLYDELVGFFCVAPDRLRRRAIRLSKEGRSVMRDVLTSQLQTHFSVRLKSEAMLNAATVQFYS